MSRLAIVRVLLGAFALAIVLVPGEVWSRPSSDLDVERFDPELQYVEPFNRHLFDPFLILKNGTWEACPCLPGTHLAISGDGLAEQSASDSAGATELAGTSVLVNGRPAQVFLATPHQVNFVLPQDTQPPVAQIELLRDGHVLARDTVGVRDGPLDGSSGVSISPDELQLAGEPGREPAVHLLTTPLSFRASFAVTIKEEAGSAVPLRVALWNPRNFSSFEMVFAADRQVRGEFLESRGRALRLNVLGTYDLNVPYQVAVEWRRGESATLTLTGPAGERTLPLAAAEAPALFDAYRPSLTIMSAGHDGRSAAALTDYHLALLPARFTTIRSGGSLVPPLMLLLAVAGALAVLSPLARARSRPNLGAIRAGARRLGRAVSGVPPVYLVAGVALAAAYFSFHGFLFTLGSQPFDMGSQKVWTYITAEYGLTDLYYVSQTATLAQVWNGIPYHEAVFPYNVAMTYYFWAIGQLHLLLFGHASPHSLSLEIMIKSGNLLFMLLDAWLLYGIIRSLKPQAKLLPWAAAALLLFNPAFVFDTGVWGETESIPLFFLLASLLAALKERPALAWPLLALAFLTKQTVLLPVAVIAVYYLLRFPWRANLEAVGLSLILVSIVILPFTLHGYPPSIAIDPTLSILWVHGGTGAERVFQVVSYDAFNLWTLVAWMFNGSSGLERFRFSDYSPEVAGMSYHHIGSLLVVGCVVGVIAWLFVRRQRLARTPHVIFLAVALVFLVELVFPTRVVSRYFLFAATLAIAGLCGRRPYIPAVAYAILSLTTLVGSYGSMALVLQDFPVHAPELAPQANGVSSLMANLFRSDVFITFAAVLNLLSVLLLAGSIWIETRGSRPAGVHAVDEVRGRLARLGPAPSSTS